MKILVTGSSGFVGKNLVAYLERQHHDVTSLTSKNCDLTQQDSLDEFSGIKYEQIYHLAAWTQAGDFCLKHPGEQWIINQQINTNVLSWWRQSEPQAKMICIGSSCAYAPGRDLREENYMHDEPIKSLYTYAMTKRMLYAGVLALHKQFDLTYLCVVPSTIYGPGYHRDKRQMHFIFDIIRKIIRGKELGEPVVLWGDGRQKRELIYAADFANLLYRLAMSHNNDLVNIGSGEEYTIRDFAEIVCDIVDYPAENIKYDAARYVGALSKFLNIQKIQKILPDYELTPLRQGLKQTVEWFYKGL